MEKEDFPKTYNSKDFEERLYAFWEQSGWFTAGAENNKPPYAIVMPPPNVTGVLHMGHALVNTLQDILIRYKRMQGYEACWIPGTDHAGIATQTVVEKRLYSSLGKRRADFSREEFINHIWEWKGQSEKVIFSQLRQLGCSCDWSKLRFTMEPAANRAVKKAFKKLFDKGLIYRGYYLVNWDPVLQTALADDEVEYEEQDGWLYYIRYQVVGKDEYITVATTRPETILGDTAIAVAPDDERYAHLIGEKVYVPFVDRQVPIISDVCVDPTFGTGAVKITPAHDKDDYRTAINHGLPMINILTPTGEINENGGIFSGLSKEQVRQDIISSLDSMGLFVKKDPYKLRVGVSYRSGAVIEPYLSKQWFVAVSSFRSSLREFVDSQDIRIFPSEFKRNYLAWVNNLRDWCISRQLWWGHQIPVWYHKHDEERVICYEGEGVPEEVAQDPDSWYQDPDVLDTWFSSGLWPLTCLGWPDEQSPILQKFYPTAVLVTGHDILFFWVTRMVLLCSTMVERKPFSDVVLHGLIFGKSYKRYNDLGEWDYISGDEKLAYDMGASLPENVVAKWEKLSKSKGNVIDPIAMIDKYGADAVRMTLASCANRGEQIDLDYRLFEEYKNFVNKIWNGARFIFQYITDVRVEDLLAGISPELLGLEDYYIIDEFNQLLAQLTPAYEQYSFDKIAMMSYEFFRKNLCSTYIEIIKPTLFGKQGSPEQRKAKCILLATLLVNMLGVLHPIVPFITEALFLRVKDVFGTVPGEGGDAITQHLLRMLRADACIVAAWPEAIDIPMPKDLHESFAFAERLVYTIRNIRGEMQLDPRVPLKAFVISADPKVKEYQSIMLALGNLVSVEFLTEEPKEGLYSLGTVDEVRLGIFVPMEQKEKERVRLEKEKTRLERIVANTSKLLEDKNFCAKANPDLVKSKEEALKNSYIELQSILDKLSSF